MNTTSERCNGCNGHGEVPSGYTRFHSGLMAWRVCEECNGVGTVEVDAEPVETPATAETITYLGQPVDAPGFTQDQFERAMARAFCDDLQVKRYHDGRHLVGYRNLYGYLVTRE